MVVLDTFKGRFSSGNSIPVERARASIEELEAIKPAVEQLKRKADKRLRLLKLHGLECTALPTRLEDISDQLDRLVSEDITVALSRNDGVVRETEMRPYYTFAPNFSHLPSECRLNRQAADTSLVQGL